MEIDERLISAVLGIAIGLGVLILVRIGEEIWAFFTKRRHLQ